jgi:phosphatidylserine decarboxylase
MNYPHPLLAREGWPFIALAVTVAATVHFYWGWSAALFFWVVVAFMIQFFRDPPRHIAMDEGLVLSPADGRVISIERTQDPYLDRPALKISVFMNVFNAHSNRSPVDGQVKQTWYFPGRFFNASLPKASLQNERAVLWIQKKDGTDVTCVQVAGLVARRILCYAKTGDDLTRGQRFGFIRFGSRVDIYLPLTAVVCAVVGDKVYATESILARFA